MVRAVGLVLVVTALGAARGQEAPAGSTPATQTPPAEQGAPLSAKASRPRARPNPDALGKYHVGDGVTAPVVVFTREPEFSEKARKAKVGGDCLVALTVGTDGMPQNVTIVRSVADTAPAKMRAAALSLDAKAIEAVKTYRFKPAMLGGQPVPVDMTVGVNFTIF